MHQWIAFFKFVTDCLGHALDSAKGTVTCNVFLQVPYSGFAMMTRVAACIGISRVIRTIAFMLTVLPSPRSDCYSRRFPPVPDTWREYLKIGFTQMRGMGGCNDLIIR